MDNSALFPLSTDETQPCECTHCDMLRFIRSCSKNGAPMPLTQNPLSAFDPPIASPPSTPAFFRPLGLWSGVTQPSLIAAHKASQDLLSASVGCVERGALLESAQSRASKTSNTTFPSAGEPRNTIEAQPSSRDGFHQAKLMEHAPITPEQATAPQISQQSTKQLQQAQRTPCGGKLACDFPGCNAEFKANLGFAFHCWQHMTKTPFVCDEPNCAHAYSFESALKRHKQSHATQPHVCSANGCKAVFSSGELLQRHRIESHGGDAPSASRLKFVCECCGARYAKKEFLELHAVLYHKPQQIMFAKSS